MISEQNVGQLEEIGPNIVAFDATFTLLVYAPTSFCHFLCNCHPSTMFLRTNCMIVISQIRARDL